MDRAGPACRGYQVTITRQHEQPGPQSLHLWAPNACSSFVGPTTGLRTHGGISQVQGGRGCDSLAPAGPGMARSHPVHKQRGRVPEEAPDSQGALLLPTPSNGPRPGTTTPPLGPKGGHTGPVRVPDQSPGGAHQRPACSAHLSSSGLSLPPPGQHQSHGNLAAGPPPCADPTVTVYTAPRSAATPPLGPALQTPTHAVTVQILHRPAQEVDPLLQSVATPLGPEPGYLRGISGLLPPQMAPDKPGATRSSLSSRPP
ncbi:hypothetical protein NDU88_001065 [Pleurodeles waltl]|uniref:Uncharacterized protein n=1 Tax=Pleurodeles waltl TaxID=8319 RepID=A0AAV7NDP6_PLEWA|nr:hypothetical protein NDU88_001065 [Pleurodeles waltl]